jgi:hypothetical protein
LFLPPLSSTGELEQEMRSKRGRRVARGLVMAIVQPFLFLVQ